MFSFIFSFFFFLQSLVLGKKVELCEGSFLPKIQLKKKRLDCSWVSFKHSGLKDTGFSFFFSFFLFQQWGKMSSLKQCS